MTRKTNQSESEMLQQVRRWRREAYEADRSRGEEERIHRVRELSGRYGLRVAEGDHARATRPG